MVGILLCCKAGIRKVFFTVWAVETRLASQEAYILWEMAQFQKVNIDESRGQGQRSNTDHGVLTEGQVQYLRPPCAFDSVNIVFFVTKQGNVMSKSTVRSLPLQFVFPGQSVACMRALLFWMIWDLANSVSAWHRPSLLQLDHSLRCYWAPPLLELLNNIRSWI